eukprot:NODE_3172_length_1032_cov_30.917599_g2915_i0.p1 GENE.NODE_3172_length_1032_cov_30.917599_g2915_i0~~NODE_3172_length_1032_cov_30.917599_g2915_i0.p1  ORF type:complete len:277 (-),score=46.05 NODE_3172_length_1032_cov_30.917599_g2915_i0:21-851(-)
MPSGLPEPPNPAGQSAVGAAGRGAFKTDWEFLRENHRFLREEGERDPTDWAVRMATRYEDRLFKEFAICDLSRSHEGKLGLRWRSKKEVLIGTGETQCANAKVCTQHAHLRTFEVPFIYKEANVVKNHLVKLRVCSKCAELLGRCDGVRKLRHNRKEKKSKKAKKQRKAKRAKKHSKKKRSKRKRSRSPSSSSTSSSSSSSSSSSLSTLSSGSHGESPLPKSEPPVTSSAGAIPAGTPADASLDWGSEKERELWRGAPQMERTDEDDMDDFFSSNL